VVAARLRGPTTDGLLAGLSRLEPRMERTVNSNCSGGCPAPEKIKERKKTLARRMGTNGSGRFGGGLTESLRPIVVELNSLVGHRVGIAPGQEVGIVADRWCSGHSITEAC